jgi:hypothetical protein
MKKFFGKFLPAMAFLFAIGAAFVTQAFDAPPVGTLKAKINGAWQPISETQSYTCVSSSDECVARFNQQNQMIPGTLVPGTYDAD